MKLFVKHFRELTVDELFEIYQLRCAVFVVEQNCPYQDVDELDRSAIHMFLKDEEGIEAYLRVMDAGTAFDEPAIGRVIARKRRMGLATQLLKEAMKTAEEQLHAKTIVLEAQVYAKGLYEKQGFVQISDEFLEDGIPHIRMRYTFESAVHETK